MSRTRGALVELWQSINAAEQYDAMVRETWPHDIYRQTVAVMGFDPLPEPVIVRQDDDAANLMPSHDERL